MQGSVGSCRDGFAFERRVACFDLADQVPELGQVAVVRTPRNGVHEVDLLDDACAFRRPAVGTHPAHQPDGVGDAQGGIDVVGDDDDRAVFVDVCGFGDQLTHGRLGRGVEAREGLIHEHGLVPGHELLGDGEALPLPTRELAGVLLGLVIDAEASE